MIGNDIVDLDLASKQSNWRRKGFLSKVFTSAEMEMIAASQDADLMVWVLWSIKEASYKAHQRKFCLPRRINWREQECISTDPSANKISGRVNVEGTEYFTWTDLDLSSKFIHTVSTETDTENFGKRFFTKPSEDPKAELLTQVARTQGYLLEKLFITKDLNGIPHIVLQNEVFPFAFSFSHHGRFSGFCFSLTSS